MKKVRCLMLLVTVAAAIVVAGCAEKEETTAEDVKREAKEAAETAKAYTEEQRAKYMAEVMDTLKGYEQKIEDLEMQAEGMGDEARVAMEKQIQALREKREDAAQKLEEMRSASQDAWMDIKTGMDKAMEDISKAYQQAAAEYK